MRREKTLGGNSPEASLGLWWRWGEGLYELELQASVDKVKVQSQQKASDSALLQAKHMAASLPFERQIASHFSPPSMLGSFIKVFSF